MVDKLRTREELYLAKIAGREVDLTGLNPPAGNNVKEVLLGEIAERLGGAAAAPAAATKTAAGVVKKAANVAVAADTAPTKAEFDALIAALITAGIMEAPASEG